VPLRFEYFEYRWACLALKVVFVHVPWRFRIEKNDIKGIVSAGKMLPDLHMARAIGHWEPMVHTVPVP